MEVLNFFGKKKEGRELSNFWEGRVEVDGRIYGSGEGAFHGSKYIEVSNVNEGERKSKLEKYGRKFEIDGEFGSMDGTELKKKGGKKGMMLNEDEIVKGILGTDIPPNKNHPITKISEINSKNYNLKHITFRESFNWVFWY